MPPLDTERLWRVQIESDHQPGTVAGRQPAPGPDPDGHRQRQDLHRCHMTYRLIKYAGAKRILFLVDRTNLGRQAHNEFQQFVSPVSGYKFTDEFNVQQLRSTRSTR